MITELYVLRHSALGSAAEAALVNVLLLAIDRSPPGRPPAQLAAEAWHLQAVVLIEVFQSDGRPDLAHTAVTMLQQVVAVTPAGHPRRSAYLTTLANALLARSGGAHAPADLDRAVGAARAAVAEQTDDGNAERPYALSCLGMCLTERFRQSGVPDLDEAVAAGRAASAALPAGDPAQLDCLGNLASALQSRFELSGQPADIDQAIEILEAALTADHADQEFRLIAQRNLCGLLLTRFAYAGTDADLAAAIASGRAAVDGWPAGDPGRAVGLGNLAAAMRARYDHTGVLADLSEAIAASRRAADAVPDGDPGRAVYLGILGMAQLILAERTGSAADADKAIAASRAAADAVPDGHPDRPGYLSGLGAALRERFSLTGRTADLDQAIDAGRAAVEATPAGHFSRGGYLTNLCLALTARYERSSDPADVEASITASRAALAVLAPDRPDYGRVQLNLGLALAARPSAGDGRRATTQNDQARQAFREAAGCETADHSVRLQAAQAWGESAGALGDWPDALRGYQEAVDLLTQSAWHGLGRADQIHILARSWGLAADAAAAAVLAGRPQRAVELLEQARGVLLGQAIDARTDRRLLSEHAPGLADQLDTVGAELDRLAAPAAEPTSSSAESRRAARRQELAGQWNELLSAARRIPGLSDFLRPAPFASLRRCADGGPVVIVNFSRHGCHCLIVTSAGLTLVPLDDVTLGEALDQVKAVRDAVAAVDGSDQGWRQAQSLLAGTLGWLWDSVTGPVIRALTDSGPRGETLPRLWWCPTGLAAFLPLHAAGRPRGPGPPSAATDHVVSSYTPTLRALLDARARAARTGGTPARMLAVALPATPGRPDLPKAEAEVLAVAGHLQGATVLTGRAATRSSLLAELPRHNFLHFAGHAVQDSFDVASGALYGYDRPVSISDLTALRLTDGRLAFLSACQTAAGALDVPDEAAHLAGALLLAGFSHVVATQWTVSDAIAPRVAQDFYPRLMRDGTTDPAGAARALHAAIQQLRHESPLLWAAYIHIGP